MIWEYRGQPIPLEVYHGVPKGWRAEEILAEHRRLGGTFRLEGPEATEPAAPSWLPERHAWLQYRQTLYRIAEGARAGDPACAELAIRYIGLRYIGSYSGFVRTRLARALKHAVLTEGQRARLHAHFRGLVMQQERSSEFGEYLRLWRRIITKPELERLLFELREQPDGEARAAWLSRRMV
jgi:hypothetical protein